MIYTAQPNPRHRSNDSTALLLHQRLVVEETRIASATPRDDDRTGQFDQALAEHIRKRIEDHLPGRIRHLTVYTTENAVILAGQCCTFYSKQLAQHTAMGVLDYEQLINNIDVQVAS